MFSAAPLGAPFFSAALLWSVIDAGAPPLHRLDGHELTRAQIDAEIARLMNERALPALAVALVENGQPSALEVGLPCAGIAAAAVPE